MMRIAEAIAHQHRAGALVTGEVVGQVASQTIENLTSINEVATLPVLRPLIGMDKDEITAEAQRLGTYPISIIPDQDCCTLFTPKHPATKARRADVLQSGGGARHRRDRRARGRGRGRGVFSVSCKIAVRARCEVRHRDQTKMFILDPRSST